jgi:nucleoid-associated protein YgaU
MAILLSKELYNDIVAEKLSNEKTIKDIYASFDNYTQEDKFIALEIVSNLNIINEEYAKYIAIYNSMVSDEKQSDEYIVTYGDTIHSIAQKMTGDYNNWKKLMRFNKLTDINLEVGQVILIPLDI